MKRAISAVLLALSLQGGCVGQTNSAGADAVTTVQVKAVTAMSLAELAYDSGESVATAAIKSGRLSKSQDADLGRLVHTARSYRDQARSLVAVGGDANAIFDLLSQTLTSIHSIAGN